mgnify:CR=1 FL=1
MQINKRKCLLLHTLQRKELSECMAEELNNKFLLLEKGKMVTVTYYLENDYVKA